MAKLSDFSKTLAAASREAKKIGGKTVVIGWKDPDIANYMAINEYGGPNDNPPTRPLIRLAAKRFTTAGRTKITGRVKADEFLENIAKRGVEALQSAFTDNSFKRNAERTIKNKGFDMPLVHTEDAFNEIDYEIRD